MPVAIAGMHRSGTSMVAKVLHSAGLYLGEPAELMPPLPENQDGFWEHLAFVDVNDKILESLGGWWDCPPAFPDHWVDTARRNFAPMIDPLVSRFAASEPWGWKDPRNSLTLPLWRSALPGLKTVICVRNPLEVALSLKRRNTFSYALSMRLWWIYHQRVLAAAPAHERIVTHYDAYFEEGPAEARRLLAFAGLATSDDAVAAAASATSRDLRHNRMTTQHLVDADAPPEVVELYLQLCAEAGWLRDSRPVMRTARPSGTETPPQNPPHEVGDPPSPRPDKQLGAAKIDRIGALRAKLAHAEHELARLRGVAATVEDVKTKLSSVESELEETRARLVLVEGRQEPLRAMLLEAQEKQLRLEDELRAAVEEVRRARNVPPPKPPSPYEELLARLKVRLASVIPPTAHIAAVSKGDEAILKVAGKSGTHFPADDAGAYAGYNPPDSADAIRRLKKLRAAGVEFLLFPNTAFWWLDHYAALTRHLEKWGRQVHKDNDCIVYRLGTPAARAAARPKRRRGARTR